MLVRLQLVFIILLLMCSVSKADTYSFPKAIEDNSMLIEEAYNQETGVCHHIMDFDYMKNSKSLGTFLTEEWPLGDQTHQIGFTFSYLSNDKNQGIGDLLLNYRYQFYGHDDFITLAPRISLLLPTGDDKKNFGRGTWGFQLNLPASKRIDDNLVIHANVGATYYNTITSVYYSYNNSITDYNFGLSGIWLFTSHINIFLEAIANLRGYPNINNTVMYYTESILNPGLRFSFNIGKTEIVPGFSVPIRTDFFKHMTYAGAFVYLSVEFPFAETEEK